MATLLLGIIARKPFEISLCLLVRAFGSRAAKERLKNPDAPPEQLGVRPEVLFLHSSVMAIVSIRNIGNAVAFLALTWSTVVLLGGFISELRIKEFWILTTMTFVMASGHLTYLEAGRGNMIYGAHADLPIGWIEMYNRSARSTDDQHVLLCAMMIMNRLSLFFMGVVFELAPYVCVGVSLARLIQQDFGDPDGDAVNILKLKMSLCIFYSLVVLQNLLCFYYFYLKLDCFRRMGLVSHMCGFGDWGLELLRRYYEETKIECQKDSGLADDWNLITFAVRLLERGSRDDYLCAVKVLDTLLTSKLHIRPVLLSKRCAFQNLVMLLGWNGQDDREIRERAARIVAYVSGELHISQFPGALQCISSLFDAPKLYCAPRLSEKSEESRRHQQNEQNRRQEDRHLQVVISNQQGGNVTSDQVMHNGDAFTTGNDSRGNNICSKYLEFMKRIQLTIENARLQKRKIATDSFASKGTIELVLQGLMILEKLTENQGNCTKICRYEVLLARIMAPLSFQAGFICAGNGCPTWLEILSRSLRVVSRLISAPGKESSRLRRVISLNKEAISNLMHILDDDKEYARGLYEHAIDILTELEFDESTSIMKGFVNKLQRIFIQCDEEIIRGSMEQGSTAEVRLRRKAGVALARLLCIQSARDPAVVLEMLRGKESSDGDSNQDVMIHLLTRVLNQIISSKMETTAEVEMEANATDNSAAQNRNESLAQQNDEQCEERKLLAAMLSLTVVICNKLMDKDDLNHVDIIDAELVQKLMNIIERNSSAAADCLGVVKLACQVVIAVIQAKPICVKDMNEDYFNKVMSEALAAMSDLDYCMVFASNDGDIAKPNRSLQSLVKEAQKVLVEAQGSLSN